MTGSSAEVQTDAIPDRPAAADPAELLDLSPGVVKTQSMRALATLRALLGEDEAASPGTRRR